METVKKSKDQESNAKTKGEKRGKIKLECGWRMFSQTVKEGRSGL